MVGCIAIPSRGNGPGNTLTHSINRPYQHTLLIGRILNREIKPGWWQNSLATSTSPYAYISSSIDFDISMSFHYPCTTDTICTLDQSIFDLLFIMVMIHIGTVYRSSKAVGLWCQTKCRWSYKSAWCCGAVMTRY